MAYKIKDFVKIVVKSKYTHHATFYVFAREKGIEKENQRDRETDKYNRLIQINLVRCHT